jgi:phosphatidylglycerophosphatase A
MSSRPSRSLCGLCGESGLSLREPAVLLATWFGVGLLPGPAGSWGSLAALPVAWILQGAFGPLGPATGATILFALGCRASDIVVRKSGRDDPGAIVIDEVAAQTLVLAVAPHTLQAYALGFLLFRIFDIAKPWPAGWADRSVKGGFGVMLDDILAALYAGLGLFLAAQFGGSVLGR